MPTYHCHKIIKIMYLGRVKPPLDELPDRLLESDLSEETSLRFASPICFVGPDTLTVVCNVQITAVHC